MSMAAGQIRGGPILGGHEARISGFLHPVRFDGPGPVFDQHLVVLAFVNRSGSSLLGEYLGGLPGAGGFQEYLLADTVQTQCGTHGLNSFPDYIRHLVHRLAGPSVFGVKASADQLAMLIRWNIPAMFRSLKVIHIRRQDVLAQAASLHIAARTNLWSSRQERAAASVPRVPYDLAALRQCVQTVQDGNAAIEALCSALGLKTQQVTYERLVRFPETVVRNAARFAGVPAPGWTAPEKTRFQKQDSPAKTAMLARLRSDLSRLYLDLPDQTRAEPAAPAPAGKPRRGQAINTAEPALSYLVLFTARSGSGWLRDLMVNAGGLADPSEHFNPNFASRIATRLGAVDFETYARRLRLDAARDNVFGAKVTPDHAAMMAGSLAEFMDHFPEARLIWLLREDIVAQAVSVYMMRFLENVHDTTGEGISLKTDPTYDATAIRSALDRLVRQERMAEDFLATDPRPVLRLSQERMLAAGRPALLASLRAHLGVAPRPGDATAESRHQKVGTSRNAEFAERFALDHPDLVAGIAAERAPRLQALDLGA